MEKVRVYELAKELNTTSKRLMEKLGEINISVKNHMSLLEGQELEALYKHIGVIRHEEKKGEADEKKAPPVTPVQPKPEVKREKRNAPRIIRTTEIVINSRDDDREVAKNSFNKGDYRGRNNDRRSEYVKSADTNSGLLSGFVRKSRADYANNTNVTQKPGSGKAIHNTGNKEAVVASEAEKAKTVAKADTKKVTKETPAERTATKKTEPAKDMNLNMNDMTSKEEKAKGQGEISGTADGIKQDKVHKEPAVSTDTQITQKESKAVEVEKESDKVKSPQRGQKTDDTKVSDKAQTNMSQPQSGRPQGGRPPYQGSRSQGGRPQGDRPPYQGSRPQGNRPPYQGSRPQGDRPPYQGSRPQGDRPPYQGSRPQGDRPPYQGSRPQGDRPPYQGNRPQGDRPPYQGNRPQGGRPPYQGGKPAGKQLDIPKPDISVVQREDLGQKNEIRREFIGRDIDKGVKREQRKEAPKAMPNRPSKRVRPTNIGLHEKKGVSEILSEEFILNEFYGENGAKKKRLNRQRRGKDQLKHIPKRAVLTSITIPETLTVKELAESLKKTSTEVIKKLMVYGIMATLNEEVDFDTATIVAEEFGIKTEKAVIINEEDILFDDNDQDDSAKLEPRPPVVVVMGHVDHGKTSLLDAIRSTHVIESEAGGITQHIGAYTVKISERNITFLDTPGHEAFTSMRARGAQVTDVAILVVAADDGVMPQTVEAINHAKAANVSIIVAINKIDKPGANPDKVKQELTQHGLVSEEWGGDTICVNVSAKKRQNIDQLLEMVLLTSDVLELKADPNRQAKGTVIEAKLDKNRGPLATVLVQRGTLKLGDSIVSGTTVGRIRAMVDDKGNLVNIAGPSTPVEILGLPDVPEAGELFYAIEDERVARHLVEKRRFKQKEQQQHNVVTKVSLDDLFKQIQEGQVKDLNIIIKADVQGSVEAVKQSLVKLTNEEVRINVIHGAVGAITESDVALADVSNAIIIGFNVRPGANVTEAAKNAGVDMRLYRVIYNAIEDIEAAMKGMLEPTFKEVILGHTEIRQIFKVSGIGTIAGCYVLDGKINRNSDVRVIRDGIVVHEGSLASLKRFKDDAKEVLQGFECGLSIEKFNDIKENDIIEAYVMEEVKR